MWEKSLEDEENYCKFAYDEEWENGADFAPKFFGEQKQLHNPIETRIWNCGGRRTTSWRTPHVFVAPATNVYAARHEPNTAGSISLFY